MATFSKDDNIYSVDMMFAYINIFKPEINYVPIKSLEHMLNYNIWSDNGTGYSPMNVLKNQKNRAYADDMTRINNADLRYPIILSGDEIIDGYHRLTKAKLIGNKNIRAYKFSSALLKKFLIDDQNNWNKVDSLKINDFIELFYKKFT